MTIFLSVGVGSTTSRQVGLCQKAEATTRPSQHYKAFVEKQYTLIVPVLLKSINVSYNPHSNHLA